MWFKQRRQRKKYKEIYNMLFDLSLNKESNYEDLMRFHENLASLVCTYNKEIFDLTKILSAKEKMALGAKLLELARTYSDNIKVANSCYIACLYSEKLSNEIKADIATFGKNSIEMSESTLKILEKVASILD